MEETPAVVPAPKAAMAAFSLSDLLSFWGIVQDPAAAALLADIRLDLATPGVLKDIKTVKSELKHLADGIGLIAMKVPSVPGLKTIYDDMYYLFAFNLDHTMRGFREDAVAELGKFVTSSTSISDATAMATSWVSEHTGISASSFGPFLLLLVQIIVKLLLAAL